MEIFGLLGEVVEGIWERVLDAYVAEKKWLVVALVLFLLILVGLAIAVVILVWDLEKQR